ncbi:MAG: hypothetical protein ACJAV2_000646 [Myxococcota bacterium]|jgi:hypothetical protein
MILLLLLLTLFANADEPTNRFEQQPDDAADGASIQVDRPNAWPGTRLAILHGDQAFAAYPDQTAVPELVVDCTRRKVRVLVRTPFPPDSTGTTDDGWKTRATIRLDLGTSEQVVMLVDNEAHELIFRKPKKLLERLLAYEQIEFHYVPFASEPTYSTFHVAHLRAVVDEVASSCGLRMREAQSGR